jgi:hypothetical protein
MEIHPKIKEQIIRFNGVLVDFKNKTIYLDRSMDIKELYSGIMSKFDFPENMIYPSPLVRHTHVEYSPINGWKVKKGEKIYRTGDVFYANEFQELLDWKDGVNNGKFASAEEALASRPKYMRK